MKRFLEKVKNEKGISMITLVVTIVLMIIIASVIIYNSRTSINVEKLDKMYADIQTLQDKVDLYYAKTGALPVSSNPSDKINAEGGKIFGIDQAESDGNVYSKIDLTKFDDIKLNYKSDYYVNDESHIVYSADGVNIDGESYHRAKDTYARIDTSKDNIGAFTITFHYKKGDESDATTGPIMFDSDTVVNLISGGAGDVDYSIGSTNIANRGIDSSYNVGWYKNPEGIGDIEKSVVMNQNYDLYSIFSDTEKPTWPEDDTSSTLKNFEARYENQNGVLYDGTWTNKNIWVKATAIDNALVKKFVLSINNVFLKEITATHDSEDIRIGYGINIFDFDINSNVDYVAVDNSDNESDKKGINLKIDKQSPSVVNAEISTTGNDGLLDDLNFKIKVKDNGDASKASGVRYISITSTDSPDLNTIDWYDTSNNDEGVDEKEFTINNKKTGAGYWAIENGTYYVWVKDRAGNINQAGQSIVVNHIDNQAPTDLTISGIPGWTNQDVTITVTAKDDYSIDHFAWEYVSDKNHIYDTNGNQITTTSGTISATWDSTNKIGTGILTIPYEMKTTIKFTAFDKAGNKTEKTSDTVKIDKVTPSGGDYPTTNSALYEDDLEIYLKNVKDNGRNDAVASGVRYYQFKASSLPAPTANDADWTEFPKYREGKGAPYDGDRFTVENKRANGQYWINANRGYCLYVKDEAGNVSSNRYFEVGTLDTQKPVISSIEEFVVIGEEEVSYSDAWKTRNNNSEWTNQDVHVRVTITDDDKVQNVTWRYNDTKIYDVAGNAIEIREGTLEGTWNESTKTWTGEFVCQNQMNTTMTFTATDRRGNNESRNSETIKIDKKAASVKSASTNNGIVEDELLINFDVQENGPHNVLASGVRYYLIKTGSNQPEASDSRWTQLTPVHETDKTRYSYNNISNKRGENSYWVTSNERYEVFIKDQAGNVSNCYHLDISSLDETKPTITVFGEGGWTNGNVSVSVGATDNDKVSKVEWKYNSDNIYDESGTQVSQRTGELAGTWNETNKEWAGSFICSNQMNTTMTFTAYDRRGNAIAGNSGTIKIDKAKPSVGDKPTTNGATYENGLKIILKNTKDNGPHNSVASGVRYYLIQKSNATAPSADNSNWTEFSTYRTGFTMPSSSYEIDNSRTSGGYWISENGNYKVYVKDQAGNISDDGQEFSVSLDTTKPTITVTGQSDWTNQNVAITVEATDNDYIDRVTWKYDNSLIYDGNNQVNDRTGTLEGTWDETNKKWTGTFTCQYQMNTTVSFTAYDRRGNNISGTSGTVKIDKAAPSAGDYPTTNGDINKRDLQLIVKDSKDQAVNASLASGAKYYMFKKSSEAAPTANDSKWTEFPNYSEGIGVPYSPNPYAINNKISDGNYWITQSGGYCLYVKDAAGNVSNNRYFEISLDTQKPVISSVVEYVLDEDENRIIYSDGWNEINGSAWINKPVYIEVTVTDNDEVDKVEWQYSGTNPTHIYDESGNKITTTSGTVSGNWNESTKTWVGTFECEYQMNTSLSFNAIDVEGNNQSENSETIKIDLTKPSGGNTPTTTGRTLTNLNINVTNVKDNGKNDIIASGIRYYLIKPSSEAAPSASDGNWTELSPYGEGRTAKEYTISNVRGEGSYWITENRGYCIYYKDQAGNVSGNKYFAVSDLDKTASSVSFDPNGLSPYQKYAGTIKVTVTDEDELPESQEVKYIYTNEGDASNVRALADSAWTTITLNRSQTNSKVAEFTVTPTEGVKYLWVKSVRDAAGNETTYVRSNQFKIDNSAPTVSTSMSGDKTISITVTDSLSTPDSYLVTQNESLTPTGNDSGWVSFNNTGNNTSRSANYTGTANGDYYVWGKDKAGNIARASGSSTIHYNYTIEYYANNPTGTTVTGSTSPYRQENILYGSNTNLIANKYSINYYSFNGWKTEGGSIVYSDEFTINSDFENIAKTNNNIVKLYAQWKEDDNDIDVDLYTDSEMAIEYDQKWINKPVYHRVSVNGVKAVDKYVYSNNSSAADNLWQAFDVSKYDYVQDGNTATYRINWDVNNTYYLKGRNSGGTTVTNISDGFNVKIDMTAPEITNVSMSNSERNVTFTITAKDKFATGGNTSSGIKYYKVTNSSSIPLSGFEELENVTENSESVITVTHTQNIPTDGKYYVWVKDQAGNVNTTPYEINIDITAPAISFDPDGGVAIKPTSGNAKISSTITTSDGQNGSGINSRKYAWSQSNTQEPSSWNDFTEGQTVTKNDCNTGIYYLWAKVTDKKGNVTTKVSKSFTVVSSSNAITITFSNENNGSQYWVNTDVLATITYSNNNAIIDKTVTCSGTLGTDYKSLTDNKVTIITNNQTVTVVGTDYFGNSVTVTKTENHIDKINPTVTATVDTNNSHKYGDYYDSMTYTLNASDTGGSGLDQSSKKYYLTEYALTNAGFLTLIEDEDSNVHSFDDGEDVEINNMSSTGTWYLYVYAADNAGNYTIISEEFKIDNVGPVISVNSVDYRGTNDISSNPFKTIVNVSVRDELIGLDVPANSLKVLNPVDDEMTVTWTGSDGNYSIVLNENFNDDNYTIVAKDKLNNETRVKLRFDSEKKIPISSQTDLAKVGNKTREIRNNIRYYYGNTSSYEYYLTNDIALDNTWSRLTYTNNGFNADFDGKDYTISASDVTNNNSILFEKITTGTVENLSINAKISDSQNVNNGESFGLLAETMNGTGTIENVKSFGSIYLGNSNNISDKNVGGIIGSISANGTIEKCSNNATITGYVGTMNAGGIVGNASNGTITKCYNKGQLSSDQTYSSLTIGGISGYSANNVTISECYNMASVTGNSGPGNIANINVGGISGYSNGTITNSFNSGNVNGGGYKESESRCSNVYVGGIVGNWGSNLTLSYVYNAGKVSESTQSYERNGWIYGSDNTSNKPNITKYGGNPTAITYVPGTSIPSNSNTGNVGAYKFDQILQSSVFESCGFDKNTIWDLSKIVNNTTSGLLPCLKFNDEDVEIFKQQDFAITIGDPSKNYAKSGDTVDYIITTTEKISTSAMSVAINKETGVGTITGTITPQNVESGQTDTFKYSIAVGSGNGKVGITATVSSKSTSKSCSNNQKFTVDNIAPTITLGTPDKTWTKNSEIVSIPMTASGYNTIDKDSILDDYLFVMIGSTRYDSSSLNITIENRSGAGNYTIKVTMNNTTNNNCYVGIKAGAISDLAGNKNVAVNSSSWGVDNTNPTLTINTATAGKAIYTATDANSGIKAVYYCSGWYNTVSSMPNTKTTNTTVSSGTISGEMNITTSGRYTFIAEDNVGNIKVNKVYLETGYTAPTISTFIKDGNNYTSYDGNSWTNKDVYIKFNDVSADSYKYKVTFECDGDEYMYRYQVNNGVISYMPFDKNAEAEEYVGWDEWVTVSPNQYYIMTDMEGYDVEYSIFVEATFGTTPVTSSMEFTPRIDKTAPQIELSNQNFDSSGETVETQISVTDSASGLATNNEYKYAITEGYSNLNPVQPSSYNTFTLSQDIRVGDSKYCGAKHLWVKEGISDKAGNVTTIFNQTYLFDNYLKTKISSGEKTGVTYYYDYREGSSMAYPYYSDDDTVNFSLQVTTNDSEYLDDGDYDDGIDYLTSFNITHDEILDPNRIGDEEIHFQAKTGVQNNLKDYFEVYDSTGRNLTSYVTLRSSYSTRSIWENQKIEGEADYYYTIGDTYTHKYTIGVSGLNNIPDIVAQSDHGEETIDEIELYLVLKDNSLKIDDTDSNCTNKETKSELVPIKIGVDLSNFPTVIFKIDGEDEMSTYNAKQGTNTVRYNIILDNRRDNRSDNISSTLKNRIGFTGARAVCEDIGVNDVTVTRSSNNIDLYYLDIRINTEETGSFTPYLVKNTIFIGEYGNFKKYGDKFTIYSVSDVTDNDVYPIPIPNGFYLVGGTEETGYVISDKEVDQFAYIEGHSWSNTRIENNNIKCIATRTKNGTTQYLNSYKDVGDNFRDNYNGKTTSDSLVGNQYVWVPSQIPTQIRNAVDNIISGSVNPLNLIKNAEIYKMTWLHQQYRVNFMSGKYTVYFDGYDSTPEGGYYVGYGHMYYREQPSQLATALEPEQHTWKYGTYVRHEMASSEYAHNYIEKARFQSIYTYNGFYVTRYFIRRNQSVQYTSNSSNGVIPYENNFVSYSTFSSIKNTYINQNIPVSANCYMINGVEYDSMFYKMYTKGQLTNLGDYQYNYDYLSRLNEVTDETSDQGDVHTRSRIYYRHDTSIQSMKATMRLVMYPKFRYNYD